MQITNAFTVTSSHVNFAWFARGTHLVNAFLQDDIIIKNTSFMPSNKKPTLTKLYT